MLLSKMSLMVSIAVISLSATPVLATPIFSENLEPLQLAQMKPQSNRGQGWNRESFMERLNLTDAQKKQIEILKKQHENEVKPIKDQLKTKEDELRTLMSNNASNDQLKSKHNEIQALRQQMGNLHFENMLEIRSVLTPEQRNQFAQMMGYRGGTGPHRRN
jgi:Spy/CpxP family protein refolding chaperone